MAEQDLLGGLTALADHGARTGRLREAADIRVRGDRRRRRRYAGSAGLGLVVAAAFGVGVALGQAAPVTERPAVPPVPPGPVATPSEVVSSSPASPSPAVRSPAVSVPPGIPQSPIKAPPPEFIPPGDGTVPPTTYPIPLGTMTPGAPLPGLPNVPDPPDR
jgi:hypothetical protein